MYKIYNANNAFYGVFKEDVLPPVHSATFNALGYNKIQYFDNEGGLSLFKHLLKQEDINAINERLNNYYYKNDLVGEGLGHSILFKRLGTDVEPWIAKDKDGKPIEPDFGYSISELHSISLFYEEPLLKYPNTSNIY